MKVIAFLTDYSVVDRIINHLKLKFVADKPPPPHRAYQEVLMAAEAGAEYFSLSFSPPNGEACRIFGYFATSIGFRAASPRPQACLDTPFAMSYHLS
jgi:hypothetical protein